MSESTRGVAAGRAAVHRGRARQRRPGWRNTAVLRTAALVIGMYLLVQLVWFAHLLFLVAFLGILFGLAVSAGVDYLQRWRVPRGVGAAGIVIGFFALLVGFGAWVAPTLQAQSGELRHRLPDAIDRVEAWLNAHRSGVLGLIVNGMVTETKADSAPQPQPPTQTQPQNQPQTQTQIPQPQPPTTQPQTTQPQTAQPQTAQPQTAQPQTAQPQTQQQPPVHNDSISLPATLKQRMGSGASTLSRYLFPFLHSTIEVVAGLLIIVFLSIYIAAEPEMYRRGIMHLFPHRQRRQAGEVLSALAVVLRRWLVTQLIAMITIGVITTTVLALMGVKAAFALGVLGGLLEFIPTVGPIMSALPAMAMGFLDSPEKALYVALAFWAIQFFENHLLIPLLMKGGMNLPPVLTILSQALMALVFGFLGLMCAVPLLAATMVVVKKLYVEGVVGDEQGDPAEDTRKSVE